MACDSASAFPPSGSGIPELDQLVREAAGRCAALTEAEGSIGEAVAAIEAAGRMPEVVFVASLFEEITEEGESGSRESELGPFLTAEACGRVESIAREHGIPTRACHVWRPSLLHGS